MSRQKDTPRQKEFDFARQDRRLLTQVIQIPSFHYVNSRGRRVYVDGTATMKLCLRVIESFCGKHPDEGWSLFLKEIADQMSKSERTACRAIADCEGGGLLLVQRSLYKHVRSHYQIVWKQIVKIVKSNPETAHHAAHLDDEGAASVPSPSGEVTHDKPPSTHDKMTFTHDILSFTHDKMTLEREGHTTSSRARGFHHDSLPKKKPSCGGKPNVFAGYAGWPIKIELPHLKNSESIQRLWVAALARADVELDAIADRIKFFALARFVARLAGMGEIANPGGYFHAQVVRPDRKPHWLGEPRDYEAAEKAIAYVDCRDRETLADRAAREGRR